MITEQLRFRYSPTSDLAIGRDDQGQLWFQVWGPQVFHPGQKTRATNPLGWSAYRPHSGLEEAEELLRLKAELDRLKAAPRPEPLPEVVREVVAELREKEAEGFRRPGVLADRLESALPAPLPPPMDRLVLIKAIQEAWAILKPVPTHQLTLAGRAADAILRLVGQAGPPPAAVNVAEVREVARLLVEGLPDEQCLSLTEMSNRLTAALGGAGEGGRRKVRPDPPPRIDEVYVLGQQWLSSGESEREADGVKPDRPWDDPELGGTDGAHPASLPCPFCGELDLVAAFSPDWVDCWLRCENCCAEGPQATIGCRTKEDDGPIDLEAEARELWNTRFVHAEKDQEA